MKKREFFKRLLGITAAAVVAPKVLLAEETPKEVVVGDSLSFNGLYEPSTLTTGSGNTDERELFRRGDYVQEVISCDGSIAEVYCDSNLLRVGDIVEVWRTPRTVSGIHIVTSVSNLPGEKFIRMKIVTAKRGDLDVKRGDFLVVKANAYAENSPKTKK